MLELNLTDVELRCCLEKAKEPGAELPIGGGKRRFTAAYPLDPVAQRKAVVFAQIFDVEYLVPD